MAGSQGRTGEGSVLLGHYPGERSAPPGTAYAGAVVELRACNEELSIVSRRGWGYGLLVLILLGVAAMACLFGKRLLRNEARDAYECRRDVEMMRYTPRDSKEFFTIWENCMAARGYTADEMFSARAIYIGR